MTDAQTLPGPLAGLRVLELADEKGQFCGKLLGDLGADVVKIEPPGGERAGASGHSSTTSPIRSAVCRSGTTTRPNAASPSIWKPRTGASCFGVWRRPRTSFWKPSGQASWRRSGLATRRLRGKIRG